MSHDARPSRPAAGVTLVELMVSLAIGALLIIGAVTIYGQSRSTYRVTEAAARLQEVARFALDVMEPDIREAGYLGMISRFDFVDNRVGQGNSATIEGTVADSCRPGAWVTDVQRPVDGLESTVGGGTGYTLNCNTVSPPVAWADVIIVRRASVNTSAPENGRIQIQSDRMRAEIFSDGAIPAAFTDPSISETRNMVVHAYYIAREADRNGLAQYSLRRQTLIGGPEVEDQQMTPGVEDLQVQFGVDTNADDQVDRYVDPEAEILAGAASQVLSVRLWLRVVAEEGETGFINNTDFEYANQDFGRFDDNRRRVLISKTIQLRNFQPDGI